MQKLITNNKILFKLLPTLKLFQVSPPSNVSKMMNGALHPAVILC
jgi:hypothetical protein